MELPKEVPEKECPTFCKRLRATPLVAEGYGCFEKLEATGSLSTPEEGLDIGNSFNTSC